MDILAVYYMNKKYILISSILLVSFLVAIAVAWGPIVSNVEQAKYTVIKNHGDIEIRDYDAMIIAEVQISGERKTAIEKGFRTIADYIFGNNITSSKIAMTAPVEQQPSEKIAMTAPVTQQVSDSGSWKIRFVMPSSYTMDDLPKPNNKEVNLKNVPAKHYAVIRFSGIADNELLKRKFDQLKSFISNQNLEVLAEPTYAFYNPPWTLPFLRRNEIMVEIKK